MWRPLFVAAALIVPFGTVAVAQQPKNDSEGRAKVLLAELLIAITDHDLSGVKSALDNGAEVEGRNWLQLTPLMWAATRGDQPIVDLLISRGAKVNSNSIYGSALCFAAEGRHESLALNLLDRGADTTPARLDGITPLMIAATDGKTKLVEKLLAKKCDPNRKDLDGATALIFAARNGRISAAKALIQAGAKVDIADSHGQTALSYAAMNGQSQMVDLLLSNHAGVDQKNNSGATPLLLAARYSGDSAVIKSLLRAGANAAAKDGSGQTALTLAQSRRFDDAAAALRQAGGQDKVIAASVPAIRTANTAITSGLNVVQTSLKTFIEHSQCTSCHHQGLGLMAVGAAAKHGYSIDQPLIGRILKRMGEEGQGMGPAVHRALSDPKFAKTLDAVDIGDFSIGGSYIFGGFAAMGIPSNPGLNEVALLLMKFQAPDGHWGFGMDREPIQSSYVTTTALALNTLRAYGPQDKIQGSYAAAKRWLLSVGTPNAEDKAARLLGLKWAGASRDEMEKPLRELMAAQRPDGGWAQLPSARSDAYATGMALCAMRTAGEIAPADPAFQKGVDYLLRTQDEDGSWYVNKRAAPANTYFDAGFPHGESQFISFGATCWAIMALTEAQPATQTASR